MHLLCFILRLSLDQPPKASHVHEFLTSFCEISAIHVNDFVQSLIWNLDDVKLVQPHFSVFIITFGIFFFTDDSTCMQELEKFSKQVYVKKFFYDLYDLVVKFKTLSLHHWRIHSNLYKEIISQYLKVKKSETKKVKSEPNTTGRQEQVSSQQQQLGLIKEAIAYVVRRK